jgi:hypothetical protein
MSTKTQDAERETLLDVLKIALGRLSLKGYESDANELGARARAAIDASAEPVVWRYFDGEGNYQYREDAPSDSSVYHASLYGRKFEPLFTRTNKKTLSDEQEESIIYAAEWLSRSEDIGNRKHAERLRAIIAEMNK